MKPYDNLLLYEAGGMTNEEALAMFHQLIDSGDVWKLPESYLMAAAWVIENSTPDKSHLN